MHPFPADYFAQHAVTVARDLLGAYLIRQWPDGSRIVGRIVETEAYSGTDDLASHGRAKRTPRNMPMYGPPGRAYVYLTYGLYWLLNVVCEPENTPAAVLIRAVEPLEGHALIAQRRPGHAPYHWTSGPARLTIAFGVGGEFNRADLTTPDSGLWLAPGPHVPDPAVKTGPRIGLGKSVREPWLSIPWRFWEDGNPYVSKGG